MVGGGIGAGANVSFTRKKNILFAFLMYSGKLDGRRTVLAGAQMTNMEKNRKRQIIPQYCRGVYFFCLVLSYVRI